ncbi:MAG: hypothetical protein ACFBSC_13750 [Microcoleaceae cyanobacterium]
MVRFDQGKRSFHQKIAAALGSIGIGLPGRLSSEEADKVNCEIDFFDYQEIPVGQGKFSYHSVASEEIFPTPSRWLGLRLSSEDGLFEVSKFQVSVGDLSWKLRDKADWKLFWSPSTATPWAITYSDLGEPFKVEGWKFGRPATCPSLTIYSERCVQIESVNQPDQGYLWRVR